MSLSINSVSSLTTSALQSSSSSSRVPGHISAAAEALGMSTSDVTDALKSGSSLADLAQQQGVSEDDLVSALVEDAPDELKSSSDVTEMVTKLVEQKGMGGPGGAGGPGGPPPGPPPGESTGVLGSSITSSQQDTLDSLADLLDTDTDSLVQSLQSGTSLSDLLENSGVSLDQLAGVVQSGLLIDTSL